MRDDVRLTGPDSGPRLGRVAMSAAGLVLASLALGGCSIPLADLPSLGGSDPVNANASANVKDADGYMAVNATPAGREEKVLEPQERAKIESELAAARERQAAAAATKSK